MVWVLQAQQSKCLWERRRLRARPTAQHPEKAKQEERARTRKRSSALAKRLLHHNGLVHLKTSTRCGMSIFLKVTTNWRAGCKKFACPVRREGRSFLRPYPYRPPNHSVLCFLAFSAALTQAWSFMKKIEAIIKPFKMED